MSKLLLKISIPSASPSMQPQIEAPAVDELTGAPRGIPTDLNVVPNVGQAALTDDNLPDREAPLEDRMVAPVSWAQAEGELSINRDDAAPNADSSTAPQLSSSGGTGETTVALVGSADDFISEPDSFFESNWHFMLVAVVFVGWVLSLMISKREPSFKPHVIQEKEKALIKNPRGQFKKSERFLKPKNKEESVEPDEVEVEVEDASESKDETSEGVAEKNRPADTKIIESKLTNNQQADTMQTDQPSDEEFDFDLTEEGGDSDAFNFEDAAEIDSPVQDKPKDNSSKRFKTEADVDASQAKSDDLFIDDDEFVTFDDQDSQLSLADSDEEFGFDLDDEEPSNFLDSGNLAAEVPPKASQDVVDDVVDDDDVDLADLGFDVDDDGLDDIKLAGDEETVQEVVEAVDPAGDSGVATGMAAAATVAAAAGGAAAAAKKGGFFSRIFGGKNKKNAAQTPAEDSPVAEEIGSASSMEATAEAVDPADQIANVIDDFDGSEALDVSDAVENTTDSLGLDDQLDPMDSLDSDDEFDFDLEMDEELGDPAELGEPAVDVSSEDDAMDLLDSGELELDLEDSTEDLGSISDSGLDLTEASVVPAEQPTAKPADELEPSELLNSGDEATLDFDSEDSGELLLDLEDSVEVDASASDVELAVDDAPVTPTAESPLEIDEPPMEEEAVTAGQGESSDSGDFGFGVFDDDTVQAVADESPAADAETNIATPATPVVPVVAAATAAVGAGIAGIAFAGTESNKGSDSDSKELQAKLSTLETRNKELSAQVADLKRQADDAAKANTESASLQTELDESQQQRKELSAQVADLKQQVDDAAKKNTESASLQTELEESQQQHKELTETVDSLTSERDQLVQEKDSIDSEKKLLAEELATAKEQLATWEQEKADLLKRQDELTAEKEAATAELESATSEHEASAKELESLQAEVTGFSDERSSFESEIKSLEAKLSAAEAKPATAGSDSGEDVEDLRSRFKLRLASEHRKRKEAQLQVDQAETQRNEVAKLLRAAKAEIVALKARQDDDDFEIAD